MFPISLSQGECVGGAIAPLTPSCSGLRAPSERMNATATCDDGHVNKMRKLDGPNAGSEITSGRSGQVSNPQVASNSPLRVDMPQNPNMPLFAAHPMYAFNPYAFAGTAAFDPRAYQAALFMQQQQLSAMSRMGFLQPIPIPQAFIQVPAAVPVAAAAVKAELVQADATPEDPAAGTDVGDTESRRSTRSQTKKRDFSQITPSDAPKYTDDDADLDETSFLLTSMTQSNSPTIAPIAPFIKLEKVPSSPEQSIASRRARRTSLTVDVREVESPTDPGSPNGPSSPSCTSPASPDSFEDKFGGAAPFSSATSKKGTLACPECGKVFSQGCSLKDHMNIHAGVRPYVCKDCGKSFSNGSNLNRHRRIHTGEKPYVCDVCQKSFSQSSNLKVHMKIH